ncbi:MAG: hypothetical protein ACE5JG_00390 [Planctomycetota bacterium]
MAVAWAAHGSPAWSDDAARELVEEASKTLAEAVKAPPTTEEQVQRARKAFRTLVKHEPEGLSKIAWTVATDERQSDFVRGEAFLALSELADSSAQRVRALVLPIVKDVKATRALRMFAALVFRKKRFANDDARAVLEQVLLRPVDDEIVQRTCLRSLAVTAELARVRKLLLRRELYDHPYYAIRIDVCSGLAALNVRDRRALEILCSLMTDEDAADKRLQVPQEAWLSFWTLTGRTHGVDGMRVFAWRPEPLANEKEMREHLWDSETLRKGVDALMVATVQRFISRNYDEFAAGPHRGRIPLIRNAGALRAASDTSRRDIDAIEAEWRGAEKK